MKTKKALSCLGVTNSKKNILMKLEFDSYKSWQKYFKNWDIAIEADIGEEKIEISPKELYKFLLSKTI